MKAFVQGEKELIPLQEEVTANSIKKSLGYTPADEEDFKDISTTDDTAFYIVDKNQNIIAKIDAEGVKAAVMTVNGKDVESGLIPDDVISVVDDSALCVTDKNGNVITRTDSEGFHAATMTVNGKDVESGLVTDEDRESWGGSDLDDVISKDDDSTLYVVDKDNNVITKIDREGLKAIDVYVGEDQKSVAEHLDDSTKHLGDEIALDDKEHLYIVDSQGNIIARFDGDGLDVTDLKIGSIHFSEHIQEIASGGSVCSHEYVVIQELDRDLTDYTNWRNLEYCTSCGKVHANLLHSDHLLKFTYYSTSGAYSVSAIDTSIFGTIKIPSAYNGTPVGSIDNFANCNNITGVIIPSTVDYINYSAFAGCNNLKYVIFEDTESQWRVYTSEGSDVDWIDFYIAEKSPSELATLLTSTYQDWSWRKFTQRKVN